MGQGVRKKIEIQEEFDDLINGPSTREPSLNDLLDDVVLPDPNKRLKVEEGTIERRPRIVPIRTDLPMGAFKTKAGRIIIAPMQKYWVVTDLQTGKLFYKVYDSATILPPEWQEGDPIPGWEEEDEV
jgi:hypothetical protein